MIIEQIYTGCLSQGAYYIESEGEIAIIDPLREVKPYIDRAVRDKAKIKYVFETHFHADFVSGHVTLADRTGATIVYGPTANPDFDVCIAKDNEVFEIGALTIIALHTPGHTMESTCYLLRNEEGKDIAIFTGDTLFLGDVGRPDLAQDVSGITKEELAGVLFDSLRNKIMPLSDDVIVYPAHGAGSACGKNMSKETVDTLGNQKKTNYALRRDMKKEEFVSEVTKDLLPPPSYFPLNVKLNKKGYSDIDLVLKNGKTGHTPEAFELLTNTTGALVLDVRNQDEFSKAHVPNSIFIGVNGGFAPWVGALIVDVNQPILLVVSEDKLEEAITRLARVGFDNTLGYLEGGIDAWAKSGKELENVSRINANEFAKEIELKKLSIFDVRKEGEYQSEHIAGALNTPLRIINDYLRDFPTGEKFYLHCAGGYRSVIAASILKSRGIHNFIDIEGGFSSIAKTNTPKTAYICPTTLS